MNRSVVLVLLALLAGGAALAVAATSGGGSDPAPPPAKADIPGVVRIGRPITPYPAGRPQTGQIEMRLAAAGGKPATGVLFHSFVKVHDGKRQRMLCFEYGFEPELRRFEIRDSGVCRLQGPGGEPWAISSVATSSGTVTFSGSADERVKRLTIAGPGGTFVVPRSVHGAFLVRYGKRAEGRAVLTATLKDGTVLYRRAQIPPTFERPGAAKAEDPGGLPGWSVTANVRDGQGRSGQTCLQVVQDFAIRAPRGQQGGIPLAPVCGDLTKDPVVVRTVRLRPSRTPSTFSPGRSAPRRTILAGAVANGVRAASVTSPAGRRTLPLADAGRAFVAVFPATVSPAQLTLEVTLADGTIRPIPNPVSVNRATTRNPPPRLLSPVRLRQRSGSPMVTLDATLSGPPTKRMDITFLGREIRMVRRGGSRHRAVYHGSYDTRRGRHPTLRAGTRYAFSVMICSDTCSTNQRSARLRVRR